MQPVGAGGSVVVFGPTAASAVAAVVRGPVSARVAGAVALLGGLALLALADLHGGAAVLGALVGVALLVRDRRTDSRGPAAPLVRRRNR